MWNTILTVNSVLLTIASTYFVYALGAAIVTWSWKPALFGLLITAFLIITEISLAAIAEP